jgi:transcriptional regulator with XRE-family HTH domain
MSTSKKIIKKIKYEYNLSQQDIADKLGVSKSFISLIETGNKKLPKNRLKQLLEIYPVDIEEIKETIDTDMEQVTELYRKFRDNKDTEAGKLLIEKLQLMVKLIDKQITIKILDAKN